MELKFQPYRDGQVLRQGTHEDMWHDVKYIQDIIYYKRAISELDIRTITYLLYQKYDLLKTTGFGLDF